MKRTVWFSVLAICAITAVFLLRQKRVTPVEQPLPRETAAYSRIQPLAERSSLERPTNALGDTLMLPQEAEFVSKIFPKFRDFVGTLERLGVSPFEGELSAASCSKIRIIHLPNGFTCPFVIGDGWTAEYTQIGSFEGITHFGQRGPDNPFRAISRADTENLSRLSQRAILMPEAEVWKVAERVTDAFGIDPARFEKPQMNEEALFDYRLGMHTVRYRAKGSDPLNQMNYTRSFTLKATSQTSAVLVRYSNTEAR